MDTINYKLEIQKLLSELETKGKDRDTIEKDLYYSENSIDQILSRGGNKKFLSALKQYAANIANATNEKTYTEQRRDIKNKPRKNQIPFFDAEGHADPIAETEMSPIHAPSGTIDIGDLLHDSEAAIRIYGNSMLPNYPPGCVVGLARVNNNDIQPGEVYIVETKGEIGQRLLKRLFYKNDDSDSEYVTLYSDNTMKFDGGARHGKLAYPPKNLHLNDIQNLFIVTGVIKRNANSIIMHRNNKP